MSGAGDEKGGPEAGAGRAGSRCEPEAPGSALSVDLAGLLGQLARSFALLLPVYALGYLGLSFSWVLLALGLLAWCRRSRGLKASRLCRALELLEDEERAVRLGVRACDLPAWVSSALPTPPPPLPPHPGLSGVGPLTRDTLLSLALPGDGWGLDRLQPRGGVRTDCPKSRPDRRVEAVQGSAQPGARPSQMWDAFPVCLPTPPHPTPAVRLPKVDVHALPGLPSPPTCFPRWGPHHPGLPTLAPSERASKNSHLRPAWLSAHPRPPPKPGLLAAFATLVEGEMSWSLPLPPRASSRSQSSCRFFSPPHPSPRR